jgi:mono/diheme cytochrome c family protein
MRIVLWGLAAVIAAAVAGLAGFGGWVWFASEAHLKSFANPPAFAAAIPTDPATLAHGKHVAVTRGCIGCHGDKLQGAAHNWGELSVAPNLALYARRQSPAVFERALRHGIGHDGKAIYWMPSFNFARMTDADVAALYGYLRAAPVVEEKLPKASLSWKLRLKLALGKDAAVPAFVKLTPPLTFQADPNPAVRRGEYLAMTSCNECHGFGLRGESPFDPPGKGPPDLIMVAAYDKADFVRLMRTGKATGNRELRLMSGVARERFSHWNDQEVDDLYVFFGALNERASRAP